MNAVHRTWKMWILRGIASLLFGVLTIARPGASVAALVLVYGVYALAEATVLLGLGLRYRGMRGPFLVRGVISGAAGVVALLYPGPTALALYILVGVWALMAGASELAIAVALKRQGARVGALVGAGVLSLACGVGLLTLPAAGMVALVGFIAAYAIFHGIALVAMGIGAHHIAREVGHAV
jgi:uncharacterized membrane protein HdeD (DUF308 family)